MENRYNIKLIEDFIKKNNLTKADFCSACKISVYSLRRIYEGYTKIRVTTLIKIVQFLHVRMKDFINI
ncbi:MAG: helix-turn-helix transcriptional regulator [Clostridia bacterium]|nr:helix-turn-helix transcriptional regulator [Clostridia bacterium]MBQ8792218.1 helix-turn-helix transcriptional regulator [Clostridia bacterium]